MIGKDLYEMQEDHTHSLYLYILGDAMGIGEKNLNRYRGTLYHLQQMKRIAYAGVTTGCDKSVFTSNRHLEQDFYHAVEVVVKNPEVYGKVTLSDVQDMDMRHPESARFGRSLAWRLKDKLFEEAIKHKDEGNFFSATLFGFTAMGVRILAPECRRMDRMESNINSIFKVRDKKIQMKSESASLEGP